MLDSGRLKFTESLYEWLNESFSNSIRYLFVSGKLGHVRNDLDASVFTNRNDTVTHWKKKDFKVNKNVWLFVVIRPLKKIRSQ